MQEFIKYILEHLCDDSSKIVIDADDESTFIIRVPKSEIGKVIGKGGRIAKAIRSILKAASKDAKPINIDIVEIEQSA
jgi:predicted RNA-binding protein YlqC (UPF0109 family)